MELITNHGILIHKGILIQYINLLIHCYDFIKYTNK